MNLPYSEIGDLLVKKRFFWLVAHKRDGEVMRYILYCWTKVRWGPASERRALDDNIRDDGLDLLHALEKFLLVTGGLGLTLLGRTGVGDLDADE